MRTTHLTFVSAAAMSISAAFVYWATPAGGVAGVARADVELAPAAMLEPDSDWFRSEAGTAAPFSTAAPTAIVTSAPLAVAPTTTQGGGTDPIFGFEAAGSKAAPVVHRNPKPAPELAEAPRSAPPKKPSSMMSPPRQVAFAQPQPAVMQQQAALPPQFPQQAAFPASTGFAASSAFPASTSRSFGSKK